MACKRMVREHGQSSALSASFGVCRDALIVMSRVQGSAELRKHRSHSSSEIVKSGIYLHEFRLSRGIKKTHAFNGAAKGHVKQAHPSSKQHANLILKPDEP